MKIAKQKHKRIKKRHQHRTWEALNKVTSKRPKYDFEVLRTVVTARPRQLTASWTFEPIDALSVCVNEDAVNEISNSLSEIIQREKF